MCLLLKLEEMLKKTVYGLDVYTCGFKLGIQALKSY
jgi:hypothetical protein